MRKTTRGGDWNDPSIWRPRGVPEDGDDVVVHAWPSGRLLTCGGDASVRSLTITASWFYRLLRRLRR